MKVNDFAWILPFRAAVCVVWCGTWHVKVKAFTAVHTIFTCPCSSCTHLHRVTGPAMEKPSDCELHHQNRPAILSYTKTSFTEEDSPIPVFTSPQCGTLSQIHVRKEPHTSKPHFTFLLPSVNSSLYQKIHRQVHTPCDNGEGHVFVQSSTDICVCVCVYVSVSVSECV